MSRKTGLFGIVVGLLAGVAIALVVAGGGKNTSSSVTTTVYQSSGAVPTSLSTSKGMSITQIYRTASPGVVDITVVEQSGGGTLALIGPGQQTQGEGAGVVYDNKGDILTDEHVVAG